MIRQARRFLLIVSLAMSCGRALSQQTSASLQGSVVEAGSGLPIAKANVELRPASDPDPATAIAAIRTGSDGKFDLQNVPPGSYRLVVNHPGHVAVEFSQQAADGPEKTLTLTAGQRMAGLRIAMTAAGVISGRITDHGQPIGQADAMVVKAIFTEGQLTFIPVLSIRADDLGEYSLFWLPPGRYYLIGVVWDVASSIPRYVNPEGIDSNAFSTQRYIGRAVFLRATAGGVLENEAHIPIYYPGTPDPLLATAIDVQPGAVLRGMDIDAGAVPIRHVRGRVLGAPTTSVVQGGPPLRITVNMRPLTASLNTSASQSPNAVVDPAGNFDINNAAPGRYMLMATAGNLSGRLLVEVRDRDITDLVVSLSTGFSLTGRLTMEQSSTIPTQNGAAAVSSLRVLLRTDPYLPGAPTFAAAVQADGTFVIPAPPPPGGVAQPAVGVPAGEYRIIVSPILTPPTPPDSPPVSVVPPALQNFYVKSMQVGDVDVFTQSLHLENQPQEPLTIVVGATSGSLEGRLVDERRQPVASGTVVLVHDSALRYRVNEKTVLSDSSGRFEISNIAPGNYKVFAWNEVERGSWQDPDFMRNIESQGAAVHIDDGKKSTIEVTPVIR